MMSISILRAVLLLSTLAFVSDASASVQGARVDDYVHRTNHGATPSGNWAIGSGRIFGTMIDRTTNEAIPGIEVGVYCTGTLFGTKWTTSEEDGRFDLDELPRCHYQLFTRGFVNGEWEYENVVYPGHLTEWPTSLPWLRLGQPIEIDRNTVKEVAFLVDRSASLSLTFRSSEVMLYALIEAYSAETGLRVAAGTAYNGTGQNLPLSTQFGGLRAGRYFFAIRAYADYSSGASHQFATRSLHSLTCGLPFCMTEADIVELKPGEHLSDINIDIVAMPLAAPGLRLLGPATQQNGLYDTRVNIFSVDGHLVGWWNQVAGGFANMHGFSLPDDFRIVISHPGSHVVAPNSSFQTQLYDGIDCGLQTCPLAAGQTPVGIADMTPVLAGTIIAWAKDGKFHYFLGGVEFRLHDSEGRLITSKFSDHRGNVIFGGLPPGTYFPSTSNHFGRIDAVWRGPRCASTCDPLSGEPIVITGGENIALAEHFVLLPVNFFSDGF